MRSGSGQAGPSAYRSALGRRDQRVLRQLAGVQGRLERLLVEGADAKAILAAIATAIGGSALLLDRSGRERARRPERSGPDADASLALADEVRRRRGIRLATTFAPGFPALTGRALAAPVPGERAARPLAWLVGVSHAPALDPLGGLCVRQGSIVLGLALISLRSRPDDISETDTVMTMVGGEVSYQA